jgi:predicted double-glycine peptidase
MLPSRLWWFCVFLLGGCSSVTPFTGLPLDKEGLYVSGVTPVRQDKMYSCGPACVAAVGTHWGVGLDQFKSAASSLPKDTTGRDLQSLAEKMGLQAFVYKGSMDDLRRNLGSGRPVITMVPMPLLPKGDLVTEELLALWNELGPRPAHWVVVVGMVGENWVILDDPASGPLAVKADRFEKGWAAKDHLSVLIASPAPAAEHVSLSP